MGMPGGFPGFRPKLYLPLAKVLRAEYRVVAKRSACPF